MNSVQLVGNLVRDPDVRFTSKGTPYARFTVACSHVYIPRGSNEAKEAVDFVPVVAWNDLAENVGNSMFKGSHVFAEGRFTTRSYEKDGQKRYISEVVANFVVATPDSRAKKQNPPPKPAPPGQGFTDMGQPSNEELPF